MKLIQKSSKKRSHQRQSVLLTVIVFFLAQGNAQAYEKGQFLRYCLSAESKHSSMTQHFLLNTSPLIQLWSSNATLSREDRPLSAELQKTFLEDILTDFINLYLDNPDTFAAYQHHGLKRTKGKSVMLYRHLCQDRDFKSDYCKENKHKIVSFFEKHFKKIASTSSTPAEAKNTQEYLKEINTGVAQLRELHRAAQSEIFKEMRMEFLREGTLSPQIQTAADFNSAVQRVSEKRGVRQKLKDYEQAYLTAAKGFPGNILFTKTMIERIEGDFFEIRFVDLVQAVNEMTLELQKDLKKLVTENPQVMSYLDANANEDLLNGSTKGSAEFLGLQRTCDGVLKSWLQSHKLLPPQIDESIFTPLKRFWVNDVKVILYLAQEQYMRALWRMRDLQELEVAQHLDDWLQSEILTDSHVERSANMGGGITTTNIVSFPHSVRGVYKPAPFSRHVNNFQKVYQGIVDTLSGNHLHEIAAYKMDRLIGLNRVPLTKEINLSTGGKGSLQYFVNKTLSAQDLNDIDIEKPRETWKFSRPAGRTLHPRNVKFFDWLINNYDRNIGNYLYTPEGRIILIDHTTSFLGIYLGMPFQSTIKEMLPSRRIYQNLKKLSEDLSLIDHEIGNLVGAIPMSILKSKITFAVRSIEDLIQKEGEEKVFYESDQEDIDLSPAL